MSTASLEKLAKIILAILLFGCLAPMPYGYFQWVRFLAMAGFGWFAYNAYERGEKTIMIISIGLALLFQPFLKVALGRSVWNIVDVLVAIAIVISVFVQARPPKGSG